ncbi:MAG TPA: hypothetical protein VKM72_14605 [Thermoanaerobaculia bacterium]|nr:hypothetical protein [Thermoanaerobaculia bacterium]
MSRSLFSRTFLVFALAAVLLVPGASAAGHRTTRVALRAPQDVLAPLWSFLGRLWVKEGCGLDPHGRCTTSPVTTDAGCGLDPSGACKPATAPESLDAGCGLDPHGQCNGI